jgi:hypothetical protein
MNSFTPLKGVGNGATFHRKTSKLSIESIDAPLVAPRAQAEIPLFEAGLVDMSEGTALVIRRMLLSSKGRSPLSATPACY